MKTLHKVPFVLGKGARAMISTLMFDFTMFLQLLLYYALCFLFGPWAVLLDYLTKSRRYSRGLAAFFNFLANL